MQSGNLTIRELRLSDLTELMEIENASFTMPWSRVDYETSFCLPTDVRLAAEMDGRLIGYGVFSVTEEEAEVLTIAVKPEDRRQGAAAALMTTFFKIAEELSLQRIFLEVRVSNEGAKKLYRELGFEVINVRRDYYVSPVEDAEVMRKELSDA